MRRSLGTPAFAPPGEEEGIDWRRYFAAVARYRWMIIAVGAVSTVVGFAGSSLLPPTYVAKSTVWIEADSRNGGADRGPFREDPMLQAAAWTDLLKSYVVLDQVVHETRRYLSFRSPGDAGAFATFSLKDRFRPGSYRLDVAEDGRAFALETADGTVVQRGTVGDSVGVALGFTWVPPDSAFAAGRVIRFKVITPRDAALALSASLTTPVSLREASFLRIELEGTDPAEISNTLNVLNGRFVEAAGDLKRRKLSELTRILAEQLKTAESNLREAEGALEGFRVRTITLPAERSSPVAPGLESTREPVLSSFFDLKIGRDQLRRDREAVDRALSSSRDSIAWITQLSVIESVRQATDLMRALNELDTKQAELRALLYRYTDRTPSVMQLQAQVAGLRTTTIPGLVRTLAAELRHREAEMDRRIGSASADIRLIPARAIEEARLRRDVAIAENLYTTLQQRFEEARLAEASSIPDVRILDRAVAPERPSKDRGLQVILASIVLGLGLATFGAIALERGDRRFQYPEQVSVGLGLPILGSIPRASTNGHGAEGDAPVVEGLRGVRLALANAYGAAGPYLVTVTSPGVGDGKSFVASNLALSFAEAGAETLLIDGDSRRGSLHRLFQLVRRPGLTDVLEGTVPLHRAVQKTQHPSLRFIPSGSRMRNSPELLEGAATIRALTELRSQFSVIIVDSPPLGVGIDPLVWGTATGNMVLVLRSGVTDRELAATKLQVLGRMPIRILGAVLNDVRPGGAYRYYSYYTPGYGADDEDPRKATASPRLLSS